MFRTSAFIAVLFLVMAGLLAPAHAQKRVALVIGNSAYEHAAPLRNPKNDAVAMAAALEKLGFEVVTGTDLTHIEFARTVGAFRKRLKDADVALFFYAGHGLQVNGHNYLAPIDAQLEDEDSLEFEAVTLNAILRLMEREERTNIVFLDACRDNPLARNLARGMGTRSTAIGRGLARIETGIGTMIAFATQPGNVALDGSGENSPFTEALLHHIETPGLDIADLMRQVRLDVVTRTRRQQVPWNHSSLTRAFMFREKPESEAKVDEDAVESAFWYTAVSADTEQAYEVYLERYPAGEHAGAARASIATLAAKRKAAEAARVGKAEAERRKLQSERERLAKERDDFARRLEELERQASARAAKAEAEKQKELEVEAERDRLAKERDDYLAKLQRLEGEAEKLASKVQANAEERKVAALAADDKPDSAAGQTTMDVGEMTLVLQAELKRVGCDPGPLDGQWGGKGREALTRFNTYAKLALPIAEPTLLAIEAIKEKKVRICPEQPKPAPAQTVGKPDAQTKAVTATRTPAAKKRRGQECLDNPGIFSFCSRGTSDPSRSGLRGN